MADARIWTKSGDSHFMEPDDLWRHLLPAKQAERMPRIELIDDGTFGHAQKTLHDLFDDVTPEVRARIARAAFEERLPHVAPAPA